MQEKFFPSYFLNFRMFYKPILAGKTNYFSFCQDYFSTLLIYVHSTLKMLAT